MQCLREIVLDTETTGLRTRDGHRIIEIGCVELINRVRTGKFFHSYLNPKRAIDSAAFAVHGISQEFIADKPTFQKIADPFLNFIGDSMLVIHNASFDMQFINQELSNIGKNMLPMHRAIDTLSIARRKFPGAQASLDALCRRFNISLEKREKHGALLDAELLALVYIEMTSGNQGKMRLDNNIFFIPVKKDSYQHRKFGPSQEEIDNHAAMLRAISNPIWQSANFRK